MAVFKAQPRIQVVAETAELNFQSIGGLLVGGPKLIWVLCRESELNSGSDIWVELWIERSLEWLLFR